MRLDMRIDVLDKNTGSLRTIIRIQQQQHAINSQTETHIMALVRNLKIQIKSDYRSRKRNGVESSPFSKHWFPVNRGHSGVI